MKLRLTLRSCPPAQGADTQRHVTTGRLVIGRAEDADWTLKDAEKVLSKRHCVVEFKGGVYVVYDTSTNGVFHNESATPIGRGNSAVLADGDRLRFGAFLIKAEFVEDKPLVDAAADPFLAVLRETDQRGPGSLIADDDDDPFTKPASGGAPMAWTRIPDDDEDFGRALLPPKPPRDPFEEEADWRRANPEWKPMADREDDGGLETQALNIAAPIAAAIPDDWDDLALDPFANTPAPEAAFDQTPIPASSILDIPAAFGPVPAIPDDWDDDALAPSTPARPTAATPVPVGRTVFADDAVGELARLCDQAEKAARSLGCAWPPPGCDGDDGVAVARHMEALLKAARMVMASAGVTVDRLEAAYRDALEEGNQWP